jgi:hypothetical protein
LTPGTSATEALAEAAKRNDLCAIRLTAKTRPERIAGQSVRSHVLGKHQRKSRLIGDLKLFEPKTMCPTIAVRDRQGR